jgi:hypothetical protein
MGCAFFCREFSRINTNQTTNDLGYRVVRGLLFQIARYVFLSLPQIGADERRSGLKIEPQVPRIKK